MSSNTFYADSEAPIVNLSAKKHFEELTTNDAKLYAHYLSRASHWGTRAVLRSVSPESENIYDLILRIHKVLSEPSSNEVYEEIIGKKLPDSKVLVTQYLEYASQFLSNVGNYKSFGDKKFIPVASAESFDKLIEAINDDEASKLYKSVREAIFSTKQGLLGWPENGHISGYYPGVIDISKAEATDVNEALADKGIMPENTRVEKKGDKEFIVHVASAETVNTTDYYPKEVITTKGGNQVTIQFGDHSKEFKHIVENLEEAAKYVANDTQATFVKYYAESFNTGSMNAHKKSQIAWVKDLKPEVESNIGFIETYRDPLGVRGEWEGLVAMVNHDRTAKFSTLVNNASELIAYLPWDKTYEKDKFTPPDFTSLEVLTFAGSGVPAGINIPNYDDVRLNYGFKNVSLGNVLSANPKKPKKEEVITFLREDLQEKFRKWRDDSFEVQVGLHELLGHGTGKLLQETAPGVFNFDKETIPTKTWYKPTDTWASLFGTTSGSFEECRAELVALYLILKKPLEVLPIFGITDAADQKDVKLIATILMARAGLLGLEFWDPKAKKWGQPHMQARFAISKVLHQAGVVNFKYTDAKKFDDLEVEIDESKLDKEAVQALGDFLGHLHVYKSTANVTDGIAYYLDKTDVTEEYARFRDVVLEKKRPRKQLIQANTFIVNGDKVEVKEYEESEVGMIQSFAERLV
ncbi:dipeptidyl-peptidase [Scheffersomyces coipomensis]|uniref:dipeptidyl-peptidase n=1 Tax=Scheffersomyces coipomensis TaxID=1788519 RepID=UPI00315CD470